MANVSWYGGPSIRAQRWPLNDAESPAQPLVSGDLGTNPEGFGPVLERYFLGSTGNPPSLCSVQQLQSLCSWDCSSSPLKQLFESSVDVSGNKISYKCSGPALCTLLHPQLHSSGFMAVGCWIQAGVQLLVSFLGGYLDYSAEHQTSGITPN